MTTQLITPDTNPDVTTIYSLVTCPKCTMTKKRFDALGVPYVNVTIDEAGDDIRDAYIDMLKADPQTRLTMPVVYPPKDSQLAPWNDFQIKNITELANVIKG